MKHTISLSIAAVLAWSVPAASAEAIAHLGQVAGDVRVQHAAGGPWQAATTGAALYAGDRVRTGAKSDAVILHANGSLVELSALAEVSLVGDRDYQLLVGHLWAKFMHAMGGGDRHVRTPALSALIRGTMLEVDQERSGTSRVVVTEGLVHVEGPHRAVAEVPAGRAVEARAGLLGRVLAARPSELAAGAAFLRREQPFFHEIPGPRPGVSQLPGAAAVGRNPEPGKGPTSVHDGRTPEGPGKDRGEPGHPPFGPGPRGGESRPEGPAAGPGGHFPPGGPGFAGRGPEGAVGMQDRLFQRMERSQDAAGRLDRLQRAEGELHRLEDRLGGVGRPGGALPERVPAMPDVEREMEQRRLPPSLLPPLPTRGGPTVILQPPPGGLPGVSGPGGGAYPPGSYSPGSPGGPEPYPTPMMTPPPGYQGSSGGPGGSPGGPSAATPPPTPYRR